MCLLIHQITIHCLKYYTDFVQNVHSQFLISPQISKLHPDFHDYVKHHGEKLEIICEAVRKKSLRASKLLRVR